MNASSKVSRAFPSFVRPAVMALALALPAAVFAANMNDSVTTRSDPNLEQKHGRDSIYAQTSAPVYSAAQVEPQRYGRAGGYVGTDRVEVMKQQTPANSAHGQGDTVIQTR